MNTKETKRREELVNDAFDYLFEVMCCNDYHKEKDLVDSFCDHEYYDKTLREILVENVKQAVDCRKEMMNAEDQDEETQNDFREDIKRGEELLKRLAR